MAYWAATRLEANRERVAQFFLEQAGYEVYLPLVRWRTRRRRTRVTPLFPGYCFTRIELQWHAIRQCPGVIRVVRCGGDEPSHVPDEIIDEIRSREHRGAIDLRRERKRLKAGDRVQIIDGILAGRRGYYAGETPKHVKVLLQMLGSERQVRVSLDAVEQI
jgi:transcription antitermination factor NusG